MSLSICIPTFNRSKNLNNLLNSIKLNNFPDNFNIEICISDNASNDDTYKIVKSYSDFIKIKYVRLNENVTRVQNYLNVVQLAENEFVWLIGDDDLFISNAFIRIANLINKTSNEVDFYFINSYNLNSSFIFQSTQPFDIQHLPEKMNKFSNASISKKLNFFDLINPSYSFDFLGGMYLSVFRKKMWDEHSHILEDNIIKDKKIFSTFENTFPHLKIFSSAFKTSKAFFYHTPLTVSLIGEREWSELYPLVRSIRLVQALDLYREDGLPILKYIYLKNYALRYFFQDIIKIILNKNNSGYEYLNLRKHCINNLLYPNIYLSIFYALLRKVKLMK